MIVLAGAVALGTATRDPSSGSSEAESNIAFAQGGSFTFEHASDGRIATTDRGADYLVDSREQLASRTPKSTDGAGANGLVGGPPGESAGIAVHALDLRTPPGSLVGPIGEGQPPADDRRTDRSQVWLAREAVQGERQETAARRDAVDRQRQLVKEQRLTIRIERAKQEQLRREARWAPAQQQAATRQMLLDQEQRLDAERHKVTEQKAKTRKLAREVVVQQRQVTKQQGAVRQEQREAQVKGRQRQIEQRQQQIAEREAVRQQQLAEREAARQQRQQRATRQQQRTG
jgi:hypothetical protein